MRVGQTNRRGCSIVSRHPVKAVGAPLLAFLIVAMAEAAPLFCRTAGCQMFLPSPTLPRNLLKSKNKR
jgi:hypothetical protein